ncbi:hypothetical protein TNCV_787281 [Trichonephila clavipes]|nr:hypothetical protein TNCV_787281 [Trichonephila clavipes]
MLSKVSGERGSRVAKVSDRGSHVTSLSPVPLKPAVLCSDARYICRELKRPPVGVKSPTKLGLELSFRFQHDKNPNHTAEIVKLRLLYNSPNQLLMAPQSSDLNPIEHLWDLLEPRIRQHNISSKDMLECS